MFFIVQTNIYKLIFVCTLYKHRNARKTYGPRAQALLFNQEVWRWFLDQNFVLNLKIYFLQTAGGGNGVKSALLGDFALFCMLICIMCHIFRLVSDHGKYGIVTFSRVSDTTWRRLSFVDIYVFFSSVTMLQLFPIHHIQYHCPVLQVLHEGGLVQWLVLAPGPSLLQSPTWLSLYLTPKLTA